jgi:hypothetical protein
LGTELSLLLGIRGNRTPFGALVVNPRGLDHPKGVCQEIEAAIRIGRRGDRSKGIKLRRISEVASDEAFEAQDVVFSNFYRNIPLMGGFVRISRDADCREIKITVSRVD